MNSMRGLIFKAEYVSMNWSFTKGKAMFIKATLLAMPVIVAGLISPVHAGDQSLKDVVASQHRTPANVARDAHRHPAEVLTFFGLQPDMKVAEIWPGGGGYFAEIIAPYVKGGGEYTAVVATLKATSDYQKRANSGLFSKFSAHPEKFAKVKLADVTKGDYDFAAADSLDMIFTFRNVHNWMMSGYDAPMLKAFHDALKTGGHLAVVEHRLDGSPNADKQVWGGYITTAKIVEVVEAAGFKLVSSSEVNANAKDTKDYEKGVWTLPPTYRMKDQDRAKYKAIGESDRATLLFQKTN